MFISCEDTPETAEHLQLSLTLWLPISSVIWKNSVLTRSWKLFFQNELFLTKATLVKMKQFD